VDTEKHGGAFFFAFFAFHPRQSIHAAQTQQPVRSIAFYTSTSPDGLDKTLSEAFEVCWAQQDDPNLL
jgi:hypothetical protein